MFSTPSGRVCVGRNLFCFRILFRVLGGDEADSWDSEIEDWIESDTDRIGIAGSDVVGGNFVLQKKLFRTGFQGSNVKVTKSKYTKTGADFSRRKCIK